MYLSRLILNPRARQVQRELARPYQMHKTILRAFPGSLPQDERVLFRLDQGQTTRLLTLLVQSQHAPNWNHLMRGKGQPYLLPDTQLPAHISHNPHTKPVNLRFSPGQQLVFGLHANPTVKRQGKRHGLYKEEEQRAWLKRKLENAGASLAQIRIVSAGNTRAFQTRGAEKNTLTMFGVRFMGVLCVVDPEKLLLAVNRGLGSGKGMGFGLLSLAPIRG